MYNATGKQIEELYERGNDLKSILGIFKMGVNHQRRLLGREAREAYKESKSYKLDGNRLDLALGSVKTGEYIGLSASLWGLRHLMTIALFFEPYGNVSQEEF